MKLNEVGVLVDQRAGELQHELGEDYSVAVVVFDGRAWEEDGECFPMVARRGVSFDVLQDIFKILGSATSKRTTGHLN